MTLLEVTVDGERHLALHEALTAFEADDGLYVPLGELMRALEFPILVDAVDHRAEGWFLEPQRSFSLELASCRVTIKAETRDVKHDRIGVRDGEIYVHESLIERWFPLELRADLSRLRLEIHAHEPLPVQRRLEREERWARLSSSGRIDSDRYPTLDVDYKFWDWPFLDAAIETRFDREASGERRRSSLYKFVGAADLMRMNARVSVTGRDSDPLSDAFVTLGRREPSRGLLGPLNASEYAVGDLATPRDPLIADTALGRGFMFSNLPLDRPQAFDRFSLRGELPLGWDAELYRNDQLIAYQSGASRDRYDFTDVPLEFGVNRFRLVFYGPQGQIREETVQRIIGPGMVRPGQHLYRATAIAERDDLEVLTQTNSGDRFSASYDYGVSQSVAIGAGVSRLALDGVERDYGSTYVNLALPGVFGRFQYAADRSGGDAAGAVISTRLLGIDITAETAGYFDFDSEQTRLAEVPGQLLRRNELRLGTYLSDLGAVGLGLGMQLRRHLGTEGERRQAETRLSLSTRYGNATHIFETNTIATRGSVNRRSLQHLLLSTRRGPVSLRGEVVHELVPSRYVSNVALSADWAFSDRATLRLGANRAPADDITTYSAGVNWQSALAALGANMLVSDEGDLTASLTVSGSLVRDPTADEWLASSNPRAQTGAVAARVFLDDNGDGDWDRAEPPIEGARLQIAGQTYGSATGPEGHTFISGLPAYRETNVVVDSASLDNPFWLAERSRRSLVLRPGRTALIDIPVTPTGSIEGIALERIGSGFRPISDLPVSLLTKEGDLLRETRTAYDGYYYFDRLPPGSYRLRAGVSERRRDTRDSLVEINGNVATMGSIDLLALEKSSHTLTERVDVQEDISVSPVSHPTPRSDSWILLQPPDFFTLQLVAVSNESNARTYIAGHALAGPTGYFRSVVDGKTWYSVVHGAFATREEALHALAALPEPLRTAHPWIRSFSTIREAMSSNAFGPST